MQEIFGERYQEMKYRRCGRSGVKMPALSLGLWQNFGDENSSSEARDIILKAFDKGITYFDLANNYGTPPGSAERNFGKIFHKDLEAHRDEMLIASKAGYIMWDGPYGNWGSRKSLIASCDQSLQRMKLDYVDIFYSHRYDPETPLEETMGALDSIVRSGKALYASISNYPAEVAGKAIEILRGLGTPCIAHQIRYSMLVREMGESLFALHKKEGVGCVSFSPLAQGLLSDKYLNGIPEGSRASREGTLKYDFINQNIHKVAKLNEIAKRRGQTLAQMAIAWELFDDRVTTVLAGASSVKQLCDNVESLKNLSFSTEELAEINAVLTSDI
jgi:L-glyceraldehyde 3-phosphate reductase